MRTLLRTLVSLALLMPILAHRLSAQSGDRLSIIVIGDAGEAGEVLSGNAESIESQITAIDGRDEPAGLMLFLGDNFYPIGLNRTLRDQQALIAECLDPLRSVLSTLGRANVHAVPGNHDYYCNLVGPIPFGPCALGNLAEAAIQDWTYHMIYPGLIRRAIADGSHDSVDVIAFDSALLLTQEIDTWRPVFDSLESMLRASAAAPGVRWRLIAAHHSPYSVGEHGGYRLWSPRDRRVEFIGNCYEHGQDPTKYIEEMASNQDNCTERYRAYTDSLMASIDRSGARVQMLMAGHDHSLQLLHYPRRGCVNCPKVFMISGAGAKRTRVKPPSPPHEYTAAINTPEQTGHSRGGYSIITFVPEGLRIIFYNAANGEVIDMGNGVTQFFVDVDGSMRTGSKLPLHR